MDNALAPLGNIYISQDKVSTEKPANNYEKRSFRIKKDWANAHRNIRRYRGYFVSNRKI